MAQKRADRPETSPEILKIPVDDLHFDYQNPRVVQSGLDEADGEDALLEFLWREMAVDEIALSIAENGFFHHEPLFVVREDGKLVVLEGNRRLAAVKLLRNPELRRRVGATDLPTAPKTIIESLSDLPVIRCKREEVWQYIGFKHVNGPQAWQSYSKAYYIARVHNKLNVPLDKISRQIGDRHATVLRLYRGWMTLEQAEKTGVFDRADRWKKHFSFSHLYTGLDYPGIQKFLGLTPARIDRPNPVPKDKVANLGHLCEWLFGSKPRNKPPVVQTQNPDLKILDEVLQSKGGTTALLQGLPLQTSQDISKGDDLLFAEALQAGKLSLQKARGTLLTGYKGELGFFETAQGISELSTRILTEMEEIRRSSLRKKVKRRTRGGSR